MQSQGHQRFRLLATLASVVKIVGFLMMIIGGVALFLV